MSLNGEREEYLDGPRAGGKTVRRRVGQIITLASKDWPDTIRIMVQSISSEGERSDRAGKTVSLTIRAAPNVIINMGAETVWNHPDRNHPDRNAAEGTNAGPHS